MLKMLWTKVPPPAERASSPSMKERGAAVKDCRERLVFPAENVFAGQRS
jgi:hypothetical protein